MSLAKIAQLNLDGESIKIEEDNNDLRLLLEPEDEEEEFLFEDGEGTIDGEINVKLEGDEDNNLHQEFEFTLPLVPGGEDQEEIEEPEEEIEEDVQDLAVVENDPWKWTLKDFPEWLSNKMENVPSHSGKDIPGIERAVAYLEKLDAEISRAVKQDFNGILPINTIAKAKSEIYDGIKRLKQRQDKLTNHLYPKKKKANEDSENLVKQADYGVGFSVNVPLLISSIARTCINSAVSGGHDIEKTFESLVKKFNLDIREKMQVIQLLEDMNYPIRRDRGFMLDEEFDATSSDNYDMGANYFA